MAEMARMITPTNAGKKLGGSRWKIHPCGRHNAAFKK
jgi:hypothetical protein